MVHPAQSPETIPQLLWLPVDSTLPECDCLFLFMFQQTAETVFRKKIYKKYYVLMSRWSIESVPEISLPPCTVYIPSFAIVSKSKLTLLFGRVAQSRQIAKLFLQSLELGLPQPLTPQASVPPSPVLGRGAHSMAREGLGESQFRRGDIYCGTLYIYCTYFVWSSQNETPDQSSI